MDYYELEEATEQLQYEDEFDDTDQELLDRMVKQLLIKAELMEIEELGELIERLHEKSDKDEDERRYLDKLVDLKNLKTINEEYQQENGQSYDKKLQSLDKQREKIALAKQKNGKTK